MFKRLRAPLCVSYGSAGGPGFRTDIVEMKSGKESRNQAWEFERSEYELRYDATLTDGTDNVSTDGQGTITQIAVDFRMMFAFHRIMAGMLHTFRARDWLNYICKNGEGFFIEAEGSPTVQQMVIRSTIGSYSYDTPVTKPVKGTITTDAVGLDYDTGQATSGTFWYGMYDKHVRFNSDIIRPAIINKNPTRGFIVGWQPLPLIEIKGELT